MVSMVAEVKSPSPVFLVWFWLVIGIGFLAMGESDAAISSFVGGSIIGCIAQSSLYRLKGEDE